MCLIRGIAQLGFDFVVKLIKKEKPIFFSPPLEAFPSKPLTLIASLSLSSVLIPPVCPSELLELRPQSQRDVQRLQHSALLRLLLPAQGLGEAPSRVWSDAAGPAAAAGRPAAGERPGVRDPGSHQLLRLHPEQRNRESVRHSARRYPPLIHPQHPVLRCLGWHTALMATAA